MTRKDTRAVDTGANLAQAVIDHFHCPDDKHSSWWLNTDELRHAFAPILAAHESQARAEAWDEGYRSGSSNAMRRMSDEPSAPKTANPYVGSVDNS